MDAHTSYGHTHIIMQHTQSHIIMTNTHIIMTHIQIIMTHTHTTYEIQIHLVTHIVKKQTLRNRKNMV